MSWHVNPWPGAPRIQTQEGKTVATCWGGEDGIANLLAAAPEQNQLLRDWEEWEADLILEHSPNVLESMSTELYDRMLELQVRRNDVLRKAGA